MNTLKELVEKMNEIYQFIESVGSMMTNGVNTWSARIDYVKGMIDSNDFNYGEFNESKKSHQKIKDSLNFDIKDNFLKLFEQNGFVEQWNKLTEEEKSSFLYYDKEVYGILRTKLEVQDFEFLFIDQQDIKDLFPTNIVEWINAPENSKVVFYKLRKAAKETIYEDFFNDPETQIAEAYPSHKREQLAINYLKHNPKTQKSDISWYDRIDFIHGKDISFSYTYNFFKHLEDQFNGYSAIKEKTNVPDILKKWAGIPIDEEKCKKEYELYHQEIKDKGINPFKEYEKVSEIQKKYPVIEYMESLNNPIDKKCFLALKNEAQGTEFESFFNESLTEKMCKDMPYKRIEYVFTYFRDEFKKQSSKKFKM